MTEQIQDQISAFMDDELSPEECAFFVRRLEHDPDARNQLIRYVTIGAVLRGEFVQSEPGILRRRLQKALSGAPIDEIPRTVKRSLALKLFKPALGFSIAASVAIVALFALRVANEVNVGGGDQAQSLQAARSTEPPSYVVPLGPLSEGPVVSPPIRLTSYLVRHGGYTSRLSRTTVHSNVVRTVEDEIPTVDEEAQQ